LKHVQHLLSWDTNQVSGDLLPFVDFVAASGGLALLLAAPLMLTALQDMPLPVQRLSFLNVPALESFYLSRPLFRTLTHLSICGYANWALNFNFVELVPALTPVHTY
jgi:hypothetical protein